MNAGLFDAIDGMDGDENFDDMGDFLNEQDEEAATEAREDLKEPEREAPRRNPGINVQLEEPANLSAAQLSQLNDPNRLGNQVQDITNMSLVKGLTGGSLSPAQARQCVQVMGYAPMNLLDKRVQRALVQSGNAHPALEKAFSTGMVRPFAMGISQASMNICCGFMTMFIARMLLTKTIMQMDVNSSGRKELRQVAVEINDNMDGLDKKRHAFVLHIAKICKDMGSMSTLLEFGANVDKIVERLTSMNMDLAKTIADVEQENGRTLSKIRSGQQFLLEVLQSSDQFGMLERSIEELQVETERKFKAYEKSVNDEREALNELTRAKLQQQYARDRALKKIELLEKTRPQIDQRVARFEQGIAKYDELRRNAESDRTAEEDHRAFQMQITEENRNQLQMVDQEDRTNRQNFSAAMARVNEYMQQSQTRLRQREDQIKAAADAAKLRSEERTQALAKQAQQAAAYEMKSQIARINAEADDLAGAIRNKEREAERHRNSSKFADNGYRKCVTTKTSWWGFRRSRVESMRQVLPNEKARLEGLASTANREANQLRDRQQALTASQTRLKSDLIGRMNQIQTDAQQRADALQAQAARNINALQEKETELAQRIQQNEMRIAAERQQRLDGQMEKQRALLEDTRQMIEDRKSQQLLVAERMYEGAKLRREQYVDKLVTSRAFMRNLKQEAEDARDSLDQQVESTRIAMQTAEKEMKLKEDEIEQHKQSVESGPRSHALAAAHKLYLDSAALLEKKQREMLAYTERIGLVNGMDIGALMTSFSQLQLAVERLPLTLNTLHDSLETAASTFNGEVFRKDLEDFTDAQKRDRYVQAMVDRVHAICEVGFQAINEPARAMMTMNSEAAFNQLQAIALEEAENHATVEEVQ